MQVKRLDALLSGGWAWVAVSGLPNLPPPQICTPLYPLLEFKAWQTHSPALALLLWQYCLQEKIVLGGDCEDGDVCTTAGATCTIKYGDAMDAQKKCRVGS